MRILKRYLEEHRPGARTERKVAPISPFDRIGTTCRIPERLDDVIVATDLTDGCVRYVRYA